MAITLTPEITGQVVQEARSYKYLFEPFRVKVSGEPQVNVAVVKYSLSGATIGTYANYVTGETDSSGNLTIDFAEVARNFMEDEVFRIGKYQDIDAGTIIPNYYLRFQVNSAASRISFIPILGGRNFNQFIPAVPYTQALTEFEYLGLDQPEFKGYPFIEQSLINPTGANVTPTITKSVSSTGKEVCGGYLIWKSRFGGWMQWGFDIMSETSDLKYNGELGQGLFMANSQGNPYIPANYTSIDESYSVSLKSLAVPNDYAEALKGLSASPAVYLMRDENAKMELMRISGIGIPTSNLTRGVDVNISLSSISKPSQNLR